MVMKYIPNDDNVNSGERVVTSGMDRIFPRDLPVGTIAEIKPGMPFKQLRVKPAASMERLQEVFVLLTMKPLELKQEPAAPAAPANTPAAAPSAAVANPAAPEKP
jgi:rod shape-determining protein MreC